MFDPRNRERCDWVSLLLFLRNDNINVLASAEWLLGPLILNNGGLVQCDRVLFARILLECRTETYSQLVKVVSDMGA